MKNDDVLKEIWRIKDECAARYKDIRDMGAALMQDQAKNGKILIAPPKNCGKRQTG